MRYFKKTDACSELITKISDLACDITTLCGIRECDMNEDLIVENMKLRIRLSESEDSSKAVADDLEDTTQLLFAFEQELDRVADLLFSARMENDNLKEENQQQLTTKQIWMEAAMEMANHTTANLKEENQQQVATKQIWMEAAMEMANQETK